MSDKDKAELKPANENPWYCLATVFGEQKGRGSSRFSASFDEDLAAKNRVVWNRWMASALSDKWRVELVKRGFDASELAPLSKKERTEFLKTFAKRTNVAPPDPTQKIDCCGVRFEREIFFRHFVFPTVAIFSGAAFDYSANFREAVFCDDAFFQEAEFSSEAIFYKATFFGVAFFGKKGFSGRAYFGGAEFFKFAEFGNRTFSDTVDFTACEFKSSTSFDGAKFLSRAPDFRDAKLRELTKWRDVEWPPPPTDQTAALMQVYAYERLKAEMERLKKHEDEQKFFAMELRARRALLWFKWHDGGRADGERTKSAFGWLLNGAYDVFSGYGLSVGSPLFWFVVLFAVGADIFAWAPVHKGAPLPYYIAEGLSLTNLAPFLPYKPDKDIIGCLSPLAKIFGNAQSLLGVILLFLLGLALRNRFRMR